MGTRSVGPHFCPQLSSALRTIRIEFHKMTILIRSTLVLPNEEPAIEKIDAAEDEIQLSALSENLLLCKSRFMDQVNQRLAILKENGPEITAQEEDDLFEKPEKDDEDEGIPDDDIPKRKKRKVPKA
eukprot:TRINITY_DN2334_c0_g1::TRINITY_DN2334_c0_g1_i1::g.20770::m.20770 TRINITY_DN2334_c0_g1::TRINITY_DN2334_c0_g1_i1::g.20770  ORF type:complete len:127 (-),score=18.00 TRINITY_DN2334_c0_g1_i1:209-589(-)